MAAHPDERLLSISARNLRWERWLVAYIASLMIAFGILAWIPGLFHLDHSHGWYRALPALGVAMLGVLLWKSRNPMCAVSLTPQGLRITRGTTEIMVPLDQIAHVYRDPGQDREAALDVRIAFREPTPFGPTIRFRVEQSDLLDGIVQLLSERAGLKLE